MTHLNLLLRAARERSGHGSAGRELLLRMTQESSATALSMLYDARQDVPPDTDSRALLDDAITRVEAAVTEIAREIEALSSQKPAN